MARTLLPYDPVTAILRSTLLSSSDLVNWAGWATAGSPEISGAYISSSDNPVMPSITICKESGKSVIERNGYQELYYYIHGWVRGETGSGYSQADDVGFLLNAVTDALDVDPVTGWKVPQLAMCRCVNSRCPLYDAETRVTYFYSRWKIHASKNLMYATT